ncbi:hypothetical protein MX015_10180 [Streptococcus uberis]|nr:hypothetical protein [Streptococcus uberis]MCK1228823.1 hypothetical protein [Streptococcus uberis]
MKQQGIDEAERFFSRENLYSLENKELVRHLNLALQAIIYMNVGKIMS